MTVLALWCGGVVSALPDWPGRALGSALKPNRQQEDPMQTQDTKEKPRTAFDDWLERFQPIFGAEGDDDDSDDAGGGDDDDDFELDGNDDDDDDDGSGGPGGGDVAELRAQLAESQRQIAAANQAARKARQEARAERERIARESGNWESVASERTQEVEDLREQNAALTEAKNLAEYNLDQYSRKVRVTTVASRMGFKDPGDAMALLNEDDTSDDRKVDRALRKLAEDKPYLVDARKASGAAMSGANGNSGFLTLEQIKAMSQEEIAANMETVQKSLAARGGG